MLLQDEIIEPQVECMRCTEIVGECDTENGICNWCHEEDHQATERYR
ncbi:hypothetical protein [Bradyrhizobium retamae]|nr:hypothetical protein [Bradyrhizobium retamae]